MFTGKLYCDIRNLYQNDIKNLMNQRALVGRSGPGKGIEEGSRQSRCWQEGADERFVKYRTGLIYEMR